MPTIIKLNGNNYEISSLSGINYGEKCLGHGTWHGTKGGIWEVGCDYGVTMGQSASGWGKFCKTGNPFADPCIVHCGIWSKKDAPPPPPPPQPPPPNGCDKAKEIYFTVYVRQPVRGKRDPINLKNMDVGHAFIGVKIGSLRELKYGFHPGEDYTTTTLMDDLTWKKVKGRIDVEKDQPYNVKKIWKIGKDGCKKIQEFLRKSVRNPHEYDLQKFNCTDFVKEAAKIAGIKNVPGGNQTPWPILNKIRGSNPGDMGEDLMMIGGERIPE